MDALLRIKPVRQALVYLTALVLVFLCAFPLFWMALTSLKPDEEIFLYPPRFWTNRASLASYVRLFTTTNFLNYLKSSLIVAGSATLLCVFASTLAGYGITRFRFHGRETFAGTILFTYMMAPIIIVVPFYILMRGAGLNNTHWGLILAYSSFALPFCMWMLRSFFQSIPLELEEAATIDGATRPQAVLFVILPLALPGVIATSIFTFIVAWNDYLFARILISSDELKTLPVGVQDLMDSSFLDWGMVMAAGVMITIPALIFFVAVQRFLIAGWGAGAVKG
jgi:ABC-type glycerol-3-phosphate transport system permease component